MWTKEAMIYAFTLGPSAGGIVYLILDILHEKVHPK